MSGTKYHHKRPVGTSAAEELRKALAFFYGQVTVEERDPGVEVTVESGLTEQELGDVVRHFLRGHHDVPLKVVAEVAPELPCALPDDDRVPVTGGVYLHGPEWTEAMDRVRRVIAERLSSKFGAPRLLVSAQIPQDVLVRAGYYKKFPNLVNVVSRIRNDYWDGVSAAQLRPGQTEALKTFYVPSDVVLNPVTCYHVYSNATALRARYDTTLFEIEGPVFRYESHNHTATRLAEFTMFELVKLGTRDEVRAEFGRLLTAFTDFFSSLGVPFRVVSASDAFFGDEPSMTRDAQQLNGSKFEVRIPVPDGELSVASVNLHGEVFADAFDLRDGVEATCCAGIGLDRLTYALLAYGGFGHTGQDQTGE